MVKKNKILKKNFYIENPIVLYPDYNEYSLGGWFKDLVSNLDLINSRLTDNFMNSKFGLGLSGLGIKSTSLGGIANTATTAIGGLLAGKNTTGVGKAMQGIGSLASNIPGVGGLIGAGVNLLGGIVNAGFGSNINEEFVDQAETNAKQQASFVSNAGNNQLLLADYSNLSFLGDIKKSDVGSDGWWSNKAGRETDRLNALYDEANLKAIKSLENTAENIDKNNLLMMQAQYAAYGGLLNTFDEGGDIKGIYEMPLRQRIQYARTGKITNAGYPITPISKGYGALRALSRFKKAIKDRPWDPNSAFNTVIKGAMNDVDKTPVGWDKKYGSKALQLGKSIFNQIVGGKGEKLGITLYETESKNIKKEGGPVGEENLSLEDFITQKINEKRTAALDKSRNRTSVRVPMISNYETEEEWKHRVNTNIRHAEELLSRLMAAGEDGDYAKAKQQELDALLEELDKGYPKLISGANCMYNAGDCYGLNIPGNETFAAKHRQLGFKKAPKGSMEPGDLVQDVRMGYPTHAMIYDSKDNENNLLFNYARGYNSTSVKENYVKQGKYPLPEKDYDVYKYVGTPADSTQWINEYKEMYNNKKAEGGNLFTNGVTTIGNGGTHESNPYEGVPMGIDQQGIPNLVEEGEVIFNDYVFSNRLRVPKEVRQKYKLKGVTFADAAKQTQKESEERPNDPISKNGLDAQMNSLMEEQEMVREAKNKNKYAKGGKLFAIGGDKSAKTIADEAMEELYKNSGNYIEPLSIASKIEGSTIFKDNIKDSPLEGITGVVPMKESSLRYAPIIGSGLAVLNDWFGGNEPDYTNADMFARAIEGTNRSIGFTPISDYMAYKPVDIERYKNRLDASAAASRSAIRNTSGGNRAAYLTGLLASDYNYGNQLGELMGNIEGINFSRYKEAKAYNKATNLANAEMAMKADMANAEQAMQRARMYGSLAEYRDAIKAKNRAEKSANLTNFIQGISDLGRERTDRDMLRWLADLGVLAYDNEGKYTGDKKSNVEAKGSRINRKKRGGFTI